MHWWEQVSANTSNKLLPFLYVESEDDVATDLTPSKTLNEESRSQMSSVPPTEGTNADEGFGTGSESDPFTEKMVSGDSKPLIRPIIAALRMCFVSGSLIYQSVLKMCTFNDDSLLWKNSIVQSVCLPPNGKQKTSCAASPSKITPFFFKAMAIFSSPVIRPA